MANSASDARQSEFDLRKAMVDDYGVDVMISVSSNFFYTVTLPCTLWFLDKGKKNTKRKDKVLFIDARNIFTQVDRAHREYTPEQLQYIANIARLYRREDIEISSLGEMEEEWKKNFPKNNYADIPGLCKVVTLEEIKEQNYSLNPGRYVGVTAKAADDFDFYEKLEELNEELEVLNAEAIELQEKISENVSKLIS